MAKRKPIYRLSFDFTTKEGMTDFWAEFVGASLQPDGDDFRTCHPVQADALHDIGKSIKHHLVRNKDPDNGKPVSG